MESRTIFGPVVNSEKIKRYTSVTKFSKIKCRIILGDDPVRIKPNPTGVRLGVKDPEYPLIGRTHEMQNMEDAMQISENPSTTNYPIIVVSGLGGIGKTQLVRGFIKKNSSTFKNIVWIKSKSSKSINETFKRLAIDKLDIKLKTVDNTDKNFESIIEEVFDRLSVHKTLLIYDNVEDIESIKPLIAAGGNLHIIITSRIRNVWHPIKVIELTVWDFDDAMQFVEETLETNESVQNKILLVRQLKRFPLALRQATAHINYKQKSENFGISDYVKKHDTEEMLNYERPDLLNRYNKTLFTTWDCTMNTVESNTLAIQILNLMAYLHPKNIHRDFFIHLPYEHLTLLERKEIQRSVQSAVEILINYSMVNSQNQQSILSVLTLVQQVIKLKLQKRDQERTILQVAVTLIYKLIANAQIDAHHLHAVSVFNSFFRCK